MSKHMSNTQVRERGGKGREGEEEEGRGREGEGKGRGGGGREEGREGDLVFLGLCYNQLESRMMMEAVLAVQDQPCHL